MNDMHPDDFDRRMRAVHARAVERLPSRTLYELQVRRANAASPAVPARPAGHGRGWWLAAGLAAVFALAIGLRQPGLDDAATGDPVPSLATAGEAVDAAAWDETLAALDEDPDLYLWLSTQDSLILAME